MKALIDRLKKSNEFLNLFTLHNVYEADATDNIRRCILKNELAVDNCEKLVNEVSTIDEALPKAVEKLPQRIANQIQEYREGWKANIAMAHIDCERWYREENGKLGKRLNRMDKHTIANNAAEHFLNLLSK